ncbi:MAG: hypothetical protein M3044_04435 [Thermoproteota archaeon]|nr:hypothetical protein [Thermoproteota archaeon]
MTKYFAWVVVSTAAAIIFSVVAIVHFASPLSAVTMHPSNQTSGSSSSNMTGGNMTSNNMTRSGTITGSSSNMSR